MSYEQRDHERRAAQLNAQLAIIQQGDRMVASARNEAARREAWQALEDAATLANADHDRALAQHRAAFRQVFGTSRHIDPLTGR